MDRVSQAQWLAINGAALLICAVFDYDYRSITLLACMLLLPLLDSRWLISVQTIIGPGKWLPASALVLFSCAIISSLNDIPFDHITRIFFLTAFPEEWFFRVYMLDVLILSTGNMKVSILLNSMMFSALHIPTQGLQALLIFLPSILFCLAYLKTRSLLFVVSLHTLGNIIHSLLA